PFDGQQDFAEIAGIGEASRQVVNRAGRQFVEAARSVDPVEWSRRTSCSLDPQAEHVVALVRTDRYPRVIIKLRLQEGELKARHTRIVKDRRRSIIIDCDFNAAPGHNPPLCELRESGSLTRSKVRHQSIM